MLVRLQYKDSGVTARIVLPQESGREAFLSALCDENLGSVDWNRHDDVVLELPRFKIESSHGLTGHLQGRGATAMFGPCGTVGTLGVEMNVSDVFQKVLDLTAVGLMFRFLFPTTSRKRRALLPLH
ncbi:Serpin 1 [Giardia muris]|uniref:Serpin 1 n=1 Tax=Giardia muris TaxID=5742 RepID=A0A4Z1STG5_GIAMU|nr:Serpin 1 [Giardia muris]|eukprot:TNJ28285.1 Serpin 1 [Giardia muris]